MFYNFVDVILYISYNFNPGFTLVPASAAGFVVTKGAVVYVPSVITLFKNARLKFSNDKTPNLAPAF